MNKKTKLLNYACALKHFFDSALWPGVLTGILLLTYPLCRILPKPFGWENGVIENAQAGILFVGFWLALVFARCAKQPQQTNFWVGLAPFWLLFFGRELSFGRALLPPQRIDVHGPILQSASGPWYAVIYFLFALYLVWGLYRFFANRAGRIVVQLVRRKKFPYFELGMVSLAMIIAAFAEHHGFFDIQIPGDRNQLLEELAELVAYLSLFAAQLKVFLHTYSKSN